MKEQTLKITYEVKKPHSHESYVLPDATPEQGIYLLAQIVSDIIATNANNIYEALEMVQLFNDEMMKELF